MKNKKVVCKKCGSENIRIDIGKSAEYKINYATGFQYFTLDDYGEFDMIGEPFCGECGEEWDRLEI